MRPRARRSARAVSAVLILHLRHGLAAHEIAHTLQRSASTVRNQIARGLDRLRRRLPASAAPAALLLPGRGLAAIRAEVLARASTASAAVTTTASLGLGALLMKKSLLVPCALVLLASVTWYAVAAADPPAPLPAATPAALSAASLSPDRRDDTTRELPPPVREPLSATSAVATDGPGALRLSVRVHDEDAVAQGVAFTVWHGKGRALRSVAEGMTSSDGTAQVEPLAPGGYEVELVGRNQKATCTVRSGETADVQLEVYSGYSFAGKVVDATGHPVADAEVRGANRDGASVMIARTASDGSFRARYVQDPFVWAVAPGRVPSKRKLVTTSESSAIRLVIGGPGLRLRGRVLDEQGHPVASALVVLGIDRHAGSQFVQRDECDVRTGADGAFALDWLPPGNLLVGALPPDLDRARATAQWLDLAEDIEAQTVLRLGDGARIRGIVRDEAGQPLPDVAVTSRMPAEYGGHLLLQREVRSDGDGRYEITGLAPGRHVLLAKRGGIQRETGFDVDRGQDIAWDPALPASRSLRLRLLDPAGQPMPGHWIELLDAAQKQSGSSGFNNVTSAEGSCWFTDLDAVEYFVRVHAQNRIVLAERRVAPDEGELELRLTAVQVPSARLSGRLVDARGAPAQSCLLTMRCGYASDVVHVDGQGRFTTDLLPPGKYTLEVRSPHGSLGMSGVQCTLAAGQHRELGDLVLIDSASLVVRLRAADGQSVSAPHLQLCHGAGMPGMSDLEADEVDGAYRQSGITPSRYVLRFFAADALPQTVPLELAPGEAREVELVAQRGVPVVLDFRFAPGRASETFADGVLSITTDAAGTRLLHCALWGYFDDYENRTRRVRTALAPGTYRIEVTDRGHAATVREIGVGTTPPAEPFIVDLR